MSCGEKALGKLGLGNEGNNSTITFTEIKQLCEIGINFIATKKKHCIALTSSGKIFSWGNNEFGQLGHENTDH